MQKIPKSYIIITLIVIIAIVWLMLSHPKNQPVPPSQIPPTTTPSTPVDNAWPSQEVKKEAVDDSNKYYDINAAYPVTKDAHIADTFKSFIDTQIAQFKEDSSWATDPAAGDSAEASALSLDIDYRESKSTHADTYIFSIASYTGGAHGLEVTRTFAYDQRGTPIAVADLFTNGNDGLKTVATYVQAQLAKGDMTDAGWVSDGAAPTTDNYQNFIITDTGVTFIFDPYQVAAYAAGAQNIDVPLSVFKSIANPDLFGN